MSLKKFSAAVIAMLAMGAVIASSASATVSTTAAQWYTGTSTATATTLPLKTTQVAKGAAVGNGFLTTEIGGLKVKLKSEAFSCASCTIENKIVETTNKEKVIASGTGKITFEKVTVVEPANCTVSDEAGAGGLEGMITTKQLNIHGDFMDTTTANQHAFIAFVPSAGAGTTFAQFVLGGTGCSAISGAKNVTGTVFGESALNTGVGATSQELIFSPTVQATSGAELKVGTKIAEFEGKGAFTTPVAGKETFLIK